MSNDLFYESMCDIDICLSYTYTQSHYILGQLYSIYKITIHTIDIQSRKTAEYTHNRVSCHPNLKAGIICHLAQKTSPTNYKC